MNVYRNITDLIGNTPMLELAALTEEKKLYANIVAKLEGFNPGGSVKDRVGLAMLEKAEKQGLIQPGAVIIEPTSGNTGIGLALVARRKGYRAILTMPETMSVERRVLLEAHGAEIVLTEGEKGMKGAIEKAQALAKEIPGSYIPDQFSNVANPAIHKKTTGPEIWRDMDGKIDIFVAGVGTGGTLSGVGEYLKEKNPQIKIIAVEPADSAVLSKGEVGVHKLQGIGAGFVPDTLNVGIYDEVVAVKTEDAFEAARSVAKKEALLVGISAGAALWAALEEARKKENENKNIVVLFPDSGERYLSTELFKKTGF